MDMKVTRNGKNIIPASVALAEVIDLKDRRRLEVSKLLPESEWLRRLSRNGRWMLYTPWLVLALLLVSPAYASDENADSNSDEAEVEWVDENVQVEDETAQTAVSTAPTGPSNFIGILKERGTRRPVSDTTVYIGGGEFETMSDQAGRFEIYLPPGEYEVKIPSTQYETFTTREKITAGEVTETVYYMEPKVYRTLEVVVHGKKEQKEVSRRVLKIEEADLIPGSNGDAVRVVNNLPGVARGGTSSEGVVVRGSNAEDSVILLDGHAIPLLFHFGGVKSVYNSRLLDEINLYTGGFGAEYGNATGGVVELKTRDPREDRWGGYVDLSLIDASAMAEGPINDDMSIALALRRSTIDIFLPLALKGNDDINFTTYPAYYDYQAKWLWDAGHGHSLSLNAYGSVDMMHMIHKGGGDEEPEMQGSLGMDVMFHSFFATHRFKNDVLESVFSPGYNFISNDYDLGSKFYLTSKAHLFDINEDLTVKLDKTKKVTFGMLMQPRLMQIDANIIRPPKEGDVAISFSNDDALHVDKDAADVLGALYFSGDIGIGPVTVIPGLRFDYESFLADYSLAPRLGLRYRAIDVLTFKAATGLYYRAPDPDEMLEPFGTDQLEFERSVHVVAGLEWNITDVISLDIQGYYKHMDSLVNSTSRTSEAGETPEEPYDNSAKGYVYGGEIMLRHNFTDKFFGWIAYSISRSMRNDGPGTPYRLFDMDQTHNLIAVASWQFYKGWRLGGRFQFTSGEPYTNITGSVFNADTGTYMPIYDPQNKNGKRTSPYHRLDLRLDKEWVFNTWILTTYLDVQGVYYYANDLGVTYNYDYSERGAFKELPILPSIGIQAEF